MDTENSVPYLRFRFDLPAALSHGVRSSATGRSQRPETAPRTVSDTVSEISRDTSSQHLSSDFKNFELVCS